MENVSLPYAPLDPAEDLKWLLNKAIFSSRKGKYNKRLWDLLQIAIDSYKIKLIIQNDTSRT
jgi:hypothetical protein